MSNKNVYHAIGLMSGSSLDGLDICYAEFSVVDEPWAISYQIKHAECIDYEPAFRNRLKNSMQGSAYEYAELHTALGKYFGELTKAFIQKNKIERVDLVASHGQTVFHQPGKGFTAQIGCGAQIAALTNCKVVCDLRTADVAHGGQGAPIVPIAEHLLFPDHKIFLNLGGIANISFHKSNREIIAYDICAANTLLNYFAQQKGKEYDENGILARSGTIVPSLLEELNSIAFCNQTPPKSLGTEHITKDWLPIFDKYDVAVEDKLATAVEHIAIQVKEAVASHSKSLANNSMLLTGGGALNSFLVERIKYHSPATIILPDHLNIQYKEALAMALIGLLRILEKENCLASVTGASKDTIGGSVYLP